MIQHNLAMFKEAFLAIKDTGCLFSSSKRACQALARPIFEAQNKPSHILEVGAGSGAATLRILEAMGPEDTLVVCELSERLCAALRAVLESSEDYQRHKERVTIFEGPIQDLPDPENKFDFIVCALPFLNFTEDLVESVFAKLFSLSKPETVMTFFEYLGIRPASLKVSPPERKRRMQGVNNYLEEIIGSRAVSIDKVWSNTPPIKVYTLNMSPEAGLARASC